MLLAAALTRISGGPSGGTHLFDRRGALRGSPGRPPQRWPDASASKSRTDALKRRDTARDEHHLRALRAHGIRHRPPNPELPPVTTAIRWSKTEQRGE